MAGWFAIPPAVLIVGDISELPKRSFVTNVAVVAFSDFQLLDLVGPYDVFAAASDIAPKVVAASLSRVRSSSGLAIVPETTFEALAQPEILLVPGGLGVNAAMQDLRLLEYLRSAAANATYVTSVCTGSLILGAAGLLDGYRATTHWRYRDLLRHFGALDALETDRVVVDRNRVTGSGVTAGIDFALTLVALLRGEEAAKHIELHFEYNPAPPFGSGHPTLATPAVLETALRESRQRYEERERIVREIGPRVTSQDRPKPS